MIMHQWKDFITPSNSNSFDIKLVLGIKLSPFYILCGNLIIIEMGLYAYVFYFTLK